MAGKKIKRNGKLMAVDVTVGCCKTDWTLEDQIEKIREELEETSDEIKAYCSIIEDPDSIKHKWNALYEGVDIITAVFTLFNMLGFDQYEIEDAFYGVMRKNTLRGYL